MSYSKLFFVLPILIFSFLSTFSQHSTPILVKGEAQGTSVHFPKGGFQYSHFSNSAVTIKKISAKWRLSTLFGQPVVDGVFSWNAGLDTPDDYLDWRDYVLLECSPVKSTGYLVYIPLMPTVPKAGKGYGFNSPGSPNWIDLFKTRTGEPITSEIPDFTAKMAREIWKNGFYVTGVVLVRYNGDKETLPVETAQKKYKAILRPYTLLLHNNDTVTQSKQLVIKDIADDLTNAKFEFSCYSATSKEAYVGFGYNNPVQLQSGWNKIKIWVLAKGFLLSDSVQVFCKENGKVSLLNDNFNNNSLSENWFISGYQSENVNVRIDDGRLLIRQGGERTALYLNSKPLSVDKNKSVVIEFTSTVMKDISCYKVWLSINETSILCRKRCDVPEHVKVIYDLQNATITSYVDGELFETKSNVTFNSADGRLTLKFSSTHFEKWYLDDISVSQP